VFCTIVVLYGLCVSLNLQKFVESMTGDHLGAANCFHSHHQSWLNIGCWNMYFLVKAEGSVATASVEEESKWIVSL